MYTRLEILSGNQKQDRLTVHPVWRLETREKIV